jgi:hypothetical protein
MNSEPSSLSLLDLPEHVLIAIASYLDPPHLKALALVHRDLGPAVETYLYRTISLPLSNQYYPVQSIPGTANGLLGLECDFNLAAEWKPAKPALAASLESFGWKDDTYQSNHLDSSLRYMTTLLGAKDGDSNSSRAAYPREMVLDLKKQYHDIELDMNTLAIQAPRHSLYSYSDIDSSEKGWNDDWEDPASSRRALLQLAEKRCDESPDLDTALLDTFTNFPILHGVKKLTVNLYESWQGYLDHVFALVPSLEELVVRPHSLLVESPLTFPRKALVNPPSRLRSIRVEGMLDCLQGLVIDLIRASDAMEHVNLLQVDRGGRNGWKMGEELRELLSERQEIRSLQWVNS